MRGRCGAGAWGGEGNEGEAAGFHERSESVQVIGVDGCRAGWLAAGLSQSGDCDARVFPDIESLVRHWGAGATVLVDMPIGLRDRRPEQRQCDALARKLLGWPRSASVFTPPARPALKAASWEKASAINRRAVTRGLSRQAWGIAGKIREVDAFLRCDATRQRHLREVHPELLFWALNDRKAMTINKKRVAGRRERLAVLERHWPGVEDRFDRLRRELRGRKVGADDLIDALVSVVAWQACGGQFQSIPEKAEYDGCGIRMEMLCPILPEAKRPD